MQFSYTGKIHSRVRQVQPTVGRTCRLRLYGLFSAAFSWLCLSISSLSCGQLGAQNLVLEPAKYEHYVSKFNANDPEYIVNLVPNDKAWDWMLAEIPWLDCPSAQLEETYYFRWWTYRKHIKQTDKGRVLTEFITPVNHAGPYNTIACAVGHHLAEGRWLKDQKLLDEYARFWFRSGENNGPAPHFHKFSSWAQSALFERFKVTGDQTILIELLDDLVKDYHVWESERALGNGLYWQFDVRDGMEESISGGRKVQNARPTISSYMAANALALAKIAKLAEQPNLSKDFLLRYDTIRQAINEQLWDDQAKFFKVKFPNNQFSDAREAIGFLPWMFDLANADKTIAWKQLQDPSGFWAPWGITTAERRHAAFRTHGTGTCEWDGAVWPFATSQSLQALANILRGPNQDVVSRRNYFDQLLTYSRSHQRDGIAYIGEYHDETNGRWLITGPKAKRSEFYNHSTFCDLVISGLVGIVPREDDTFELDPLLPDDAWDWFCLDNVTYHGRKVTIIWDRNGEHYQRGTGLVVFVDGLEKARRPTLGKLVCPF